MWQANLPKEKEKEKKKKRDYLSLSHLIALTNSIYSTMFHL
jgi:hypothetical protein